MTHLTDIQLDELKEALMNEKKELEAHFEAEEEQDPSLMDSSGELSTYDNHPADLGTETFERSRDIAVDDTLEEQLQFIRHSLEQMDSGAYGKCLVCGCEIPFERLQAVPYASTCVEHAEQIQQGGSPDSRPIEEQVMTRPPAGAGEKRQEYAGSFDDADAWQSVESYGNSDSPAMSTERNVKDYDQISSDKMDK